MIEIAKEDRAYFAAFFESEDNIETDFEDDQQNLFSFEVEP